MRSNENRSTDTSSGHAPSTRLPEAMRVGGVRLQVSHLERSLAYYVDVIGLRVIEASVTEALLGVPESVEPLVTLVSVPGTQSTRRRGSFGLFHFAILLPERTALGRFVAHLAAAGERAGMSDHRVSEAIYLSDPDGLGIEVYADRSRDTWRYEDGQLVMTTDPLDVDDLVRSGAGDVWRGAPAGTTMGHIHLHVGDLEAAAAFYQRDLGFDTTVWTYPGARFFSAGGYHHHLGTNTWAAGPSPSPDHARLLEWTLVAPSAGEVNVIGRRLRAAGHPTMSDALGWTVDDPWGTRLRVKSANGNR